MQAAIRKKPSTARGCTAAMRTVCPGTGGTGGIRVRMKNLSHLSQMNRVAHERAELVPPRPAGSAGDNENIGRVREMGKRGPGARPKGSKTAQKGKLNTTKDLGSLFLWRDETLPMAERVILFIEELPITSGKLAGTTMRLRDWQKDFIRSVYGPQRDGRRLVRTALLSLPRKNGKTQLLAALALAHLCGPCAEMRGQIYSAASDRNQASLIFKELVAVIERMEWMSDRLNVKNFNKIVEDIENGSTYEAMSSDARKAHGLSPSFIICDEVAQWRGRELYDNLISGMDAREQPLCIVIGTQSADDLSLMSELVDYSERISNGEITDETFHGVVYAAQKDADWLDEAVWHAANPALSDFKSLTGMRAQATQAKRIPVREASFRNLHLNQRIDAEVRFISAPDWIACGDEPVDAVSLYGRPCWAGLDLSSVSDLTSLVLYFPHDGGAVLPFFWIPSENIQDRSDTDRVPYRVWRDQGLIEATPGRAVDYKYVVRRLAQITADFDLQLCGFDRWRIDQIKRIMAEEGIDIPLENFGQGFRDMGPAVDALEAAVLDKKLRHGSNAPLTWCMSNTVVETDPAGSRKLSKRRSREKIDGAVALAMALGCYEKSKAPERVLTEEDFFVI